MQIVWDVCHTPLMTLNGVIFFLPPPPPPPLRFQDNVHRGNVMGSAPSDKNLIQFKNAGMQTTHCNESVLRSCSVIFLTVKPNILPTVLGEIYSLVTPEHLLISVAAGITVQTLEKLLPAGTRVLRTMPNLACQVQEGTMVFCRGSHATEQDASHLQRLMSGCSLCEETPEAFINIHSGLSGSGVAYAYMFAEALADGGVKMGMPYHLSLRLAGQTLVVGIMYVCECVRMCVCAGTCVCGCACVCACLRVCVRACVFVCVHLCVWPRVCACVCVCVFGSGSDCPLSLSLSLWCLWVTV
uniref:Pyrroline-5-carboxylate reductase 3 n=1 Tax=Callorhinchus milii TaxID=7868 RepID=A0A4W3GVQ6_CALMI